MLCLPWKSVFGWFLETSKTFIVLVLMFSTNPLWIKLFGTFSSIIVNMVQRSMDVTLINPVLLGNFLVSWCGARWCITSYFVHCVYIDVLVGFFGGAIYFYWRYLLCWWPGSWGLICFTSMNDVASVWRFCSFLSSIHQNTVDWFWSLEVLFVQRYFVSWHSSSFSDSVAHLAYVLYKVWP